MIAIITRVTNFLYKGAIAPGDVLEANMLRTVPPKVPRIYTYSILDHVANSTAKSSRDIKILHQNMLPAVPTKVPVIYAFYIKTCCQQYRKTFP
jgi:hypothetical protein